MLDHVLIDRFPPMYMKIIFVNKGGEETEHREKHIFVFLPRALIQRKH